MARVKRRKRRASLDAQNATNKKQRIEKAPEKKRIAARLALQTSDILRGILSSLPLLDRLRNRRITKSWKETVDTFSDLRNNPFFEPQDAPREIIIWATYDRLGNIGPFLANGSMEDKLRNHSIAPIITVHPLLERMDTYIKKNAIPGSALAHEPTPGKFSFYLRVCPEWFLAMQRDYKDRRWRKMYITQPPCIEIPELYLYDEDGITLGMLTDKFADWQALKRKVVEDDESPPSPFKIEMGGVRDGSIPVRMARGEIEMGTMFVPAVHGF